MIYLDGAPTMDPSLSPRLNQLGYYIMDAKIIEMVIKYNWLHKLKQLQLSYCNIDEETMKSIIPEKFCVIYKIALYDFEKRI